MDNTHKTFKNIKIIHRNAIGITNKKQEFANFLGKHKPDIAIITETKKINDEKPHLYHNYELIFKNRKTDKKNRGGGIAIYTRNNWSFEEITINTTTIEAVAISIAKIIIVAVYQPPTSKFSQRDLDTITRLGEKIILFGVFNAKHRFWNCQHSDNNGENLLQLTLNNDLTIYAPDEATHIPQNGNTPSIIDLAITKNIHIWKIETIEDLPSDHLPVEIHSRRNTSRNTIEEI